MFRRFGLRPDVFLPLGFASAALPLALLLPVVHFSWALKDDTTFSVLTGTKDLLHSGHTFVGMLILVFSILFPTAKILALYALWFIPLPAGASGSPLRWLEFLGKWSMLDVFVVAILIGTLDLGILSETTPRPGAYVFTGMVLLSMAATLRQIRWAQPPGKTPTIPPRPSLAVPAFAVLALALLVAGLTRPMMEVDKWLFWSKEFSVLEGTFEMFRNGYGLMAATVTAFVVAAPVAQILAAAGLWALGGSPENRSRLAAGLRAAGRWSMADVFALGIVVVVAKIGSVVNVEPRPGLWLFVGGAVLGSVLGGWLTAPPADRRAHVREFSLPIS